jgi:hypothetical protein
MRKVAAIALLLAVAACGTPARWEKPGATDQTTAADAVECRRAASQESFLYNPYGWPPPLWPYRRGYWLNWHQMQESQRFYARTGSRPSACATRVTNWCPSPRRKGKIAPCACSCPLS